MRDRYGSVVGEGSCIIFLLLEVVEICGSIGVLESVGVEIFNFGLISGEFDEVFDCCKCE